MNLILCHQWDRDAIWLHLNLQQLGVDSHLVAPEQILMAKEWTQSLDDDEFVIELNGGQTLHSGGIGFVFNRVQMVDAPLWRLAGEGEREYVRAEMTALLMSWLYQVQQQCSMINPPVGNSLSGVFWSEAQWTKAAFGAGFNDVALACQQTGPMEKILVIDDEVITPLRDDHLHERCTALAKLAQSPLLEITVRDGGRTFIEGNPLPPLRVYGDTLLGILLRRITGKK